jgi:hypothetical protein
MAGWLLAAFLFKEDYMSDYRTAGANSTYFISYEWDSDQKRAALAKALAPEERGVFHYLNHDTRLAFVRSGNTRVARLLEGLYLAGCRYGWITVDEAEELVKRFYRNPPKGLAKSVRRSLEALTDLISLSEANVRRANMGYFFPKIDTINSSVRNWEKFPPISHKSGIGFGGKKERPKKCYWIPPYYAMNEVFGKDDNTFVAIPVRALESDVTYKAFVWKSQILKAGGRLSIKQTEMAEELNISRSTQKSYAVRSGTREVPFIEEHRLSWTQIAVLPKDGEELQRQLSSGDLHFRVVRDESGRQALACREDICERGLTGHLYADLRTKTIYQDESYDAWIVKDKQNG